VKALLRSRKPTQRFNCGLNSPIPIMTTPRSTKKGLEL
jgi:hypothetical protein